MRSKRTSRLRSARRNGERGFAMLEILIAFVVLALGLGVILSGIAVATRSDHRTQARLAALRLAQSRLETAGIAEALVPGTREGRASGNFRWRQTVTAVRSPPEPQQTNAGSPASPSAANPRIASYWVDISVQAADGTTASLSGLKLAIEKPGAETKR